MKKVLYHLPVFLIISAGVIFIAILLGAFDHRPKAGDVYVWRGSNPFRDSSETNTVIEVRGRYVKYDCFDGFGHNIESASINLFLVGSTRIK